jgi:hypothetical protein
MSKLTDLVEGIIIASDIRGRNKVRFCASVENRLYLLKAQGFTIHDIVNSAEKMSRTDILKYALNSNFDHVDSKKLVQNLLFKYDQEAFRQINNKNLLAEIASRPKRDTDITNKELDSVLGNL